MEGDFDWDDPTLADAIDVNELYLSEERMSLIANHIVQNHKAKTRNRQYTAIFAVSSIEALVKYYDIFKSIKHDLNISGIFSYGQNEDAEGKDEHSRDALERIIKDYNEMYSTNFSTDTFAAYHKDISDRVKGKKTKPLDILLVVNMFLTGFDSKMLRSTGTGYPAINADDLAEIPIWVPPLDQQEKIGAALSFLGEKIEAHQKLLSALCCVKSSLLQQLFI